MIGTITPRRSVTPLMKSGGVGDADYVFVAANLLHLETIDGVLLLA